MPHLAWHRAKRKLGWRKFKVSYGSTVAAGKFNSLVYNTRRRREKETEMFHLCWSLSRSGTHVRIKMRAKKFLFFYFKSNFRKSVQHINGKVLFLGCFIKEREKSFATHSQFFSSTFLYLLYTHMKTRWYCECSFSTIFAIYIFSTCSLTTHERSGLSWKLLAKEFLSYQRWSSGCWVKG